MSAVSIMGNSTVSMAFWGSWFCPGGSGGEALMSACPAFGSLSEQHPTSCQCRILSLLCLQVTLRKERAVQRTEQKPDFRRWFSWSKEEIMTSLFSFSFILTHLTHLQKGSPGMVSKQDLVWCCGFLFVFFLFVCFWFFREHLDVRNDLQINVGLRSWDFCFATNPVAKNTWSYRRGAGHSLPSCTVHKNSSQRNPYAVL